VQRALPEYKVRQLLLTELWQGGYREDWKFSVPIVYPSKSVRFDHLAPVSGLSAPRLAELAPA
jgi:hypothetical protein